MRWIETVLSLFDFLTTELATVPVDVELGNDAKDPRKTTLRVIRGTGDLHSDNTFDSTAGQVILLEGWVYNRNRQQAYEQLAVLLELTLNLVNVWRMQVNLFKFYVEIQQDTDDFDPSFGFRLVINTVAIGHDLTEGCIDENRRALQNEISG